MNKEHRELLWISLIYSLSQFFLIISTGHWWDDWHKIDRNFEHLYEGELLSSLPLNAYVRGFFWLFPDGWHKYFVFCFYLIGAMLLYKILHQIDLFSDSDCFWITVLYTVMPINDARITWICSCYAIGLLTFWITFYLAVKWRMLKGAKKLITRGVILVLLFFAFNTESIMIMTLLLMVYYMYEENKNKIGGNSGEIVSGLLRSFMSHIDLIVLPILFYFGKHILYPADVMSIPGQPNMYKHNYVDWKALPMLVCKSPVWMVVIFGAEFVYNLYKLFQQNIYIIVGMIVFGGAVTLGFVIYNKKHNFIQETITKKKAFLMLCVGVFSYYIGLFPYYIKNHGYVATREYDGRHSLLLGLGSAMIVYYLIALMFKGRIKKMLYLYFVIFGIVFFNVKYLDWQEDYYQSLRFEQGILGIIEEYPENDVFLCYVKHPGINIEEYRFEGNVYEATGQWGRRVYLSPANALEDENLDGIILFDNEPISYRVLIKEKQEELLFRERFSKWIAETSGIRIIPVTREERERMLERYGTEKMDVETFWEYIYMEYNLTK